MTRTELRLPTRLWWLIRANQEAHVRAYDWLIAAALGLLALTLTVWAFGCGGGGRKSQSPETVPDRTYTLSVFGGSVEVESRGCGLLDPDRIHRELETAWKRATGENPDVAKVGWAGFRLIFASGVSGGSYVGDGVALLGCGAYGAVEHEPGHHWAHVLRLPCAGAEIWHGGGFDLRCRRLP